MGIYGLTMDCFSELKRSVLYFNQIPKFNSGYEDKTAYQTIWVTYQNVQMNKLNDSNGNLVTTDGQKIRCDIKLQLGWFIKDGNVIYRIHTESGYKFESNLYTYDIERVVGDDGINTKSTSYNLGNDIFG